MRRYGFRHADVRVHDVVARQKRQVLRGRSRQFPGVRVTHEDFEGRATSGYDAVDGDDDADDGNG
ncbi:hypothetical protein, partial [Nocardia salmonicida]|uniref:hypothetical protein n=1 Tax=Nocardia salmonicida TaxID=53431 RepID=UPI003659E027